MRISQPSISRRDVFDATSALGIALQRTVNRTGLISIIVSSLIAGAGIAVELLLIRDFGYVLIAIGILGVSVGAALRFTR